MTILKGLSRKVATMADTQTCFNRRRLRTSRAAGIARILFSLLDVASLVPSAGIAFLWFIGVICDHMGDLEDRFFVTVFLGSGFLFLASTFVGAALAGVFTISIGTTFSTQV